MRFFLSILQWCVSCTAPVLAFVKKLNLTSGLAVAGMAGPLVLLVTDLTAGLSSPGYSYVRDSISSLALTENGWLQTIGFLTIGLLVEIFVAGLLFNIKGVRGFGFSIALLVIFGFGMLLLGAFHTDPVGAPDTTEGVIHDLAAGVVFWAFPLAVLIISFSIRRDYRWQAFYRYTVITSILALVLTIAVTIADEEMRWFGLLERIVVANTIFWVVIAAFRMFAISLWQE